MEVTYDPLGLFKRERIVSTFVRRFVAQLPLETLILYKVNENNHQQTFFCPTDHRGRSGGNIGLEAHYTLGKG